MAEQEPWTIRRILAWTIDYLGKRGDEHPRLSSEWLVSNVTGLSRVEIYMKLNSRRTILVGFAFLSICSFWQMYNNVVPLILTNTFHMCTAEITGISSGMLCRRSCRMRSLWAFP